GTAGNSVTNIITSLGATRLYSPREHNWLHRNPEAKKPLILGPFRLKIRTVQCEHSCYAIRFLHLNIPNDRLRAALHQYSAAHKFFVQQLVALCGALLHLAARLRRNSASAAHFEGKLVPVAHFFHAAATSARRQTTPVVCNALKLLHMMT